MLSAKLNTDVLARNGELAGGNTTDRAIFRFFSDADVPRETVKKKIPFSSSLKYSSVTLNNNITLIKDTRNACHGVSNILVDKIINPIDTPGIAHNNIVARD